MSILLRVLAAHALAVSWPMQALALPADSANEGILEVFRLPQPIEFDGRTDDAAWAEAPVLPLTQYSPVYEGQPSQRTEVRLAHDGLHLYVAGRFHDSEPSSVRMNSLYRDRLNGDDTFSLYVDAFNDDQNARVFTTTPAGIRVDALISDDGATQNENWDGFWYVETSRDDEGWSMEMKIPFSTIGFQTTTEGSALMGVIVTRLVARNEERVTFPAIDPGFSFNRPSLARDVILRDVRVKRPINVTPYLLLGESRREAGGAAGRQTSSSKEAGLDARLAVSSTLTLDVTVNTDFAQVEADGQQVALDRFPLFFPERRRFFQENSGLFDFVTAGGARLFHSRRIGLTETGEPVRILGGARLVGRIGSWEMGALDLETDGAGALTRENAGIFRLRRPLLNSSSTAGVMVTSYRSGDIRNTALALDTNLRVKGDEYLTLKWAATLDREGRSKGDLWRKSLVDAKWQRRTGRGLAYTGQFSHAGPDYRPRLGFLPRTDFTTANVVANWFKFTDRSRYFRRVYPGALAFTTFRNHDQVIESAQYAFWVQWDTKAGGGGWVEPKWFRERVVAPFRIGGAVDVPAGVYDFADLQIAYSSAAGAPLRTDLDLRFGSYFDGRRFQVIASPTWVVSPHLDLGLDYQFTRLRFPVRKQAADLQLVGLRIRAAADAHASIAGLFQYNSASRKVNLNVRLRYAVSEGTDFWLVYNEGLERDLGRDEGPRSWLRSVDRTVILKYSRTFGG